MSKTVMIPASEQEMWVCRINHKEYSYPQGTEQSVPDEVAELIASINAQAVKATPEEQATWEVYSQGGWIPMQGGDSLPDTTSASAGDVLSLDSDKEPVWSAPSGGGGMNKYYLDTDNIDHETIEGDYYDLTPLKKTSDNTQVTYNDVVNAFSSGIEQVLLINDEDGLVNINSLSIYGNTDNPSIPTYTHLAIFKNLQIMSKGATSYLYLVEGGVPPQ